MLPKWGNNKGWKMGQVGIKNEAFILADFYFYP